MNASILQHAVQLCLASNISLAHVIIMLATELSVINIDPMLPALVVMLIWERCGIRMLRYFLHEETSPCPR